jgi:hypothetical protein
MACPALGIRSQAINLFFFLSTNKQKTAHQSESNSAISWTPAHRKPPYTAPHRKKKQTHFFLPAGFKAACVKLQNEQVNITHHAQLP